MNALLPDNEVNFLGARDNQQGHKGSKTANKGSTTINMGPKPEITVPHLWISTLTIAYTNMTKATQGAPKA